MGRKALGAAGLLLAGVTIATLLYPGSGLRILGSGPTSEGGSRGVTCSAGPYAFTDLELTMNSLRGRVLNNSTVRVSPGRFTAVLGPEGNNAVNLTASDTQGFFSQGISPGGSGAVEFRLRDGWILAPATYAVTLRATSEEGILYSCGLRLESPSETKIDVRNATLTVAGNGTSVLGFDIANTSDGLLSAGAVCLVGEKDCLKDAGRRFEAVAPHSVVHLRRDVPDGKAVGGRVAGLVLDAGVVYIFPVNA